MLGIFFIASLSLIAGSSIGPVAPLVLIGAAMGSLVAVHFREDADTSRCLNLCGGAACLSNLFGFPIVSAFIVLEWPHRNGVEYFEYLPPVIWSSCVSHFFGHLLSGMPVKCDPSSTSLSCFSYDKLPMIGIAHIPIACGYGVVAALIALTIIASVKALRPLVDNLKTRYAVSAPVSMCLGGFLLGLVGVLYPQSIFWGKFQIQALLSLSSGDEYPVPWIASEMLDFALVPAVHLFRWHYLQLAVAKMVTIIICLSSGFVGGVTFPSMLVGAFMSRFLFPHDDIALMCIMGGVVAAVCRTPLGIFTFLVFSMRLKSGSGTYLEGAGSATAVEGIGATIASLAVSIFVAMWLTSPYCLFEVGNRRAFAPSSNAEGDPSSPKCSKEVADEE